MSLLTPLALVEAIGVDPVALARMREYLLEPGPGPSTPHAHRPSPYMNAEETADYLRLPRGVKRVYELVADRTLTRHGTRGHLLLLREEVEALARGTG